MQHSFDDVNIGSLSPMQKMELADVLYDAAMQEIERVQPLLNAEQLRELDRTIERLHAGDSTLVPSRSGHAQLTATR